MKPMLGPLDLAFGAEPTGPPSTPDAFARAAIFAVCEASVAPEFARRTYQRCMVALAAGATARLGFRHIGKAEAVDLIWRDRHQLYQGYLASADKLEFLDTLPWIGPVTRRRLARRLGVQSPAQRAAAA
jgi:hypothetical protein